MQQTLCALPGLGVTRQLDSILTALFYWFTLAVYTDSSYND